MENDKNYSVLKWAAGLFLAGAIATFSAYEWHAQADQDIVDHADEGDKKVIAIVEKLLADRDEALKEAIADGNEVVIEAVREALKEKTEKDE